MSDDSEPAALSMAERIEKLENEVEHLGDELHSCNESLELARRMILDPLGFYFEVLDDGRVRVQLSLRIPPCGSRAGAVVAALEKAQELGMLDRLGSE